MLKDPNLRTFIITLLLSGLITIITVIYASRYFHNCFIYCSNKNFLYKFCKTVTYDMNGYNKKILMKNPCILNLWNISHILMFTVLSFKFSQYRFILFLVGILWEIGEAFLGHNNNLDILWNAIGIIIGAGLHNLYVKIIK